MVLYIASPVKLMESAKRHDFENT